MAEWYMRGEQYDQAKLSRILDVAQDLKVCDHALTLDLPSQPVWMEHGVEFVSSFFRIYVYLFFNPCVAAVFYNWEKHERHFSILKCVDFF